MKNKKVELKDYQPTPYQIEKVNLTFHLFDEHTLVENDMTISLREGVSTGQKLILNGEELVLKQVDYNGKELSKDQYQVSDEFFEFIPADEKFQLKIITEIYPQKNFALEGLYFSDGMFCTQNEAEGFRKITYYYDRPDVLSLFETTVIADKKYPHLLANGNCIERGDSKTDPKRHWVKFFDPFAKPCYLFALVAGDFDVLEDEYTTMSGKKVDLQIYVDKGDLPQTHHAMESLKRSMKWDEERFSLEYDLKTYMIVAVSSFNMGAMENKGLNIFNSLYVLGNEKTATDQALYNIESVIAHEYFHNYTGNRVTCRDWFQLTLKEGLTVYRDQEFSSDLHSRAVKRIDDVMRLRQFQFREDDSSFAHPIQPKSYEEINNFYTQTVYEKGAEVVRMYETLLGRENFTKGVQFYLQKHDGTGATVQDFLQAMEHVSGEDLSHFSLWYDVQGTPQVKITENYDQQKSQVIIVIEQFFKDSNNQNIMCIPLNCRWYNSKGEIDNIQAQLPEDAKSYFKVVDGQNILVLQDKLLKLEFNKVIEKPTFVWNRNFSAPIHLIEKKSSHDLQLIAQCESDFLTRWEIIQSLMKQVVCQYQDQSLQKEMIEQLATYLKKILTDSDIDDSLKAFMLRWPSEMEINSCFNIYPFDEVAHSLEFCKNLLAKTIQPYCQQLLKSTISKEENIWDPVHMGVRELKWQLLESLLRTQTSDYQSMVVNELAKAQNMTNEMGALKLILKFQLNDSEKHAQRFFDKWKNHSLVMDQYISLRVYAADKDQVFSVIESIEKQDYYDDKIPNKVRSLLGPLVMNQLQAFHSVDGRGYDLLKQRILKVDQYNPQLAARICKFFVDLRKLDSNRRERAKIVLESIAAHHLSKDTKEVIGKFLNYQ